MPCTKLFLCNIRRDGPVKWGSEYWLLKCSLFRSPLYTLKIEDDGMGRRSQIPIPIIILIFKQTWFLFWKGTKEIPEEFLAVPLRLCQICIIHLMRSSKSWERKKDRTWVKCCPVMGGLSSIGRKQHHLWKKIVFKICMNNNFNFLTNTVVNCIQNSYSSNI